jgi:predicted transcriptional regulator
MAFMADSGEPRTMTFRLSAEAHRLLQALAEANGVSMTGVIELAIREKAKRQKIR